MDECIWLASIGGDESKTFRIVEPFYRSCCHDDFFPLSVVGIGDSNIEVVVSRTTFRGYRLANFENVLLGWQEQLFERPSALRSTRGLLPHKIE